MKNIKILLSIIALIFITNNSFAKRIEIIKGGGSGNNLYDRIQETHSLFSSRLSCLNPGSADCHFLVEPIFNGGHSYTEIEAVIMERIRNGNSNGRFSYENDVFVSWSTDPANGFLHIIMDDKQ